MVANRRLDGRSRRMENLLGFLLIVAVAQAGRVSAGLRAGLKAGLRAPASKLLLEKRYVPYFSLVSLPFSFILVVAVVSVSVMVFFVVASVSFVSCAAAPLPSFSGLRLAQLVILAIDCMLHIAWIAIGPDAPRPRMVGRP